MPAAVMHQQIIQVFCEKVQGGKALCWEAIHCAQGEGSAVCHHHSMKQSLCHGHYFYSQCLGLYSFCNSLLHSSLSSMVVFSDSVCLAGCLFKGWLHLTIQPCFCHHCNVHTVPQNKAGGQVTNVSVETFHVSKEDCQLVTSPWHVGHFYLPWCCIQIR